MANGTIKNGTAVIVPISNPSTTPTGWHMKGQAVYDPNTNTVRFTLICTSTGYVTVTSSIGNIPAPYRPKVVKDIYTVVRMDNNAVVTAYEGNIQPDGNIYELATNGALGVFATGEYSLD